MKKKLFAIYFGGKHENGFIEDHDLVFVVARDKDEAKRLAKQKTKIREDLHCDGVVMISNVDGYSVKIVEEGEPEDLKYDNKYQKLE